MSTRPRSALGKETLLFSAQGLLCSCKPRSQNSYICSETLVFFFPAKASIFRRSMRRFGPTESVTLPEPNVARVILRLISIPPVVPLIPLRSSNAINAAGNVYTAVQKLDPNSIWGLRSGFKVLSRIKCLSSPRKKYVRPIRLRPVRRFESSDTGE